jgi:hypothetical protein
MTQRREHQVGTKRLSEFVLKFGSAHTLYQVGCASGASKPLATTAPASERKLRLLEQLGDLRERPAATQLGFVQSF